MFLRKGRGILTALKAGAQMSRFRQFEAVPQGQPAFLHGMIQAVSSQKSAPGSTVTEDQSRRQDASTKEQDNERNARSECAGPLSVANEASEQFVSLRKMARKQELVAAFTCNECGTRSVRGFSRVAYERGVVIAKCGGCQIQHLLSDRLGWLGEKGDVEDFLAEQGQAIRKQMDGTLEVSEEDLMGWSKKDNLTKPT